MPNDNPIYIGSVPSSTDNPKYMGSFSGAGGGGSGTVTVGGGGSGTVNQIPKFSAATAIVDSILRESGTTIIAAGCLAAEGSANTLTMCGSATDEPVTFTATGTDPHVPIEVFPKGNGYFQINSSLESAVTDDLDLLQLRVDINTAGESTATINGIFSRINIDAANAEDFAEIKAGAQQFVHEGSGDIAKVYANNIEVNNSGSGGIGSAYGQFVSIGGGGITNAYASFTEDLAGAATNPYYFWGDSRGVIVIKEDNTFDSVGQAIARVYNPLFTKYTAGAADYERTVFGQWNGNVAEIGTEAGGTGTLRDLRLLGQLRSFTIADSNNIVLNTTTGTKIGTATTQKLGFYNAAPVVQGASVADATGGVVIDIEARAAINALISRIEATGLIATV